MAYIFRNDLCAKVKIKGKIILTIYLRLAKKAIEQCGVNKILEHFILTMSKISEQNI